MSTRAKKQPAKPLDPRDASLRVSKSSRDRLKAHAAFTGRALYDVTNEIVETHLKAIGLAPRKSRANGAAAQPAVAQE